MGLLKKSKKDESPAADVELKVVNQKVSEQEVIVEQPVEEQIVAEPVQFGHQSRDFQRKLNGI